jgi:hypothetical protein
VSVQQVHQLASRDISNHIKRPPERYLLPIVVTAASGLVYANRSRGQGSLKRPSSNRQLRDSKGRTAGSVIEQMLLLGVLTGGYSTEIKVRTSVSMVQCGRVDLDV